MTNKKINILLVLFVLLVFGVLVVFLLDLNCPIKSTFHIPCPGCGLTRAFRLIFKGQIFESFKYNILGFPLFLFLTCLVLLIIYDLIRKQDYTSIYLDFFVKHYKFILIVIAISWIFNIIRGV